MYGFLSGLPINAYKGLNRGILCEIYAHGATGDKKDVYQRLYERLSEIWVRNGCLTHAISIFAHEKETVDTWFHLGFGNRCVDAMRPLSDVTVTKNSHYQIIIATENDAERLLAIEREDRRYFNHAPLFMPIINELTIDNVREFLTSKDQFTWIALDNEKPVAKMNIRKGREPRARLFSSSVKLRGFLLFFPREPRARLFSFIETVTAVIVTFYNTSNISKK